MNAVMAIDAKRAEELAEKFWFAATGVLGGSWGNVETVTYDETDAIWRVVVVATESSGKDPHRYEVTLFRDFPAIHGWRRL